jgi:hypothetical protein
METLTGPAHYGWLWSLINGQPSAKVPAKRVATTLLCGY